MNRTRRGITAAAGMAVLAAPLALTPAHANDADVATPSPLSAARVLVEEDATTMHRRLDNGALDAALRATVNQGAPGAVAAARTPKGRWSSAAGVRELGGKQAQRHDKFRIGSITKPMVATVLLQLVEEGKLSLDSTVDEVRPGLLGKRGNVTLRQLLSHRSGAPDYLLPLLQSFADHPDPQAAHLEPVTEEQLVKIGLSQKWLFEPGTSYTYSNTGYIVAGLMAEKVTGQSIESLVETRIFARAGMRSSSMPTDTTFPGPHLKEHTNDGTAWTVLGGQNASWFGAAGSVVSTTEDVNRFFRALVTGRLLSKKSFKEMATPLTTSPTQYGLGLAIMPDACSLPRPDTGSPADKDSTNGKGKGRKAPRVMYGHNGATFGTMSLALVSADGKTQANGGLTGRIFTVDGKAHDGKPQPDISPVVIRAMQSSC